MKINLVAFTLLAACVGGCAAPVASEHDSQVKVSSEALTLQECTTQQDTCFAQNPFFGLFTCPGQFAQCVVTATNGIPAQVMSAIQDATDCQTIARNCREEAPNMVLKCTNDEAECISAIIDARLPPIVTGTAACVDDSVTCIRASRSAADLAACTQTLQGCAVDQAVSALPPAVGTVVRDLNDCLDTLGTCTGAATSASELTQCSQDEISCVGDTFDVPIAQPPVAAVVHCAETAARCGLRATTPDAVRTCAQNLTTCNAGIATQQLTCAQKWNQCLVTNPFNFLGCTADFAVCTDPTD